MRLRVCQAADSEPARRSGLFAHSLHRPGFICVSRAFHKLPAGHRAGILVHEVGHVLLAFADRHSEADATWAGSLVLDARLRYRRSRRWGCVLWTSPRELPRITRVVAALPGDEFALAALLRRALLGADGDPNEPATQATSRP